MLEDVLGTYKKEIAELESYLLLNGKIYLNVHICIMKISYASGMQHKIFNYCNGFSFIQSNQ